MNPLKQLENAPRNLVLYVIGLLGAVVDDYTLVTLTIFCVLLGFTLGSVLIPLTAFFGLYFLLRLVIGVQEVLALHANRVGTGLNQVSQGTMHVANALMPPHERDVPVGE